MHYRIGLLPPRTHPPLQIAKAILSGQRLAVPPREAQPGPDRLPPDVERDYLQVTAMGECCFKCWLWLGRHSAPHCVIILEYRHVPQCTVSMWTPGVCQLRVSVKDSSFNLFSLSPALAQLMQRCWAQEPEERPSFDAVAAQLRWVAAVLLKL